MTPTIMTSIKVAALAVLLGAIGLIDRAVAAEDATITAFSAWQGQGEMFKTGAEEATFLGALGGTVYVETEHGPLQSGHLVCPFMLKIDLKTAAQTGSGNCTITAADGAQIFAEVSCAGIHLVGCNGDFKLTGGTDRFKEISGGGPVVVRSEIGGMVLHADSGNLQTNGIMYWKALHYSIP